jgi:hypothetical protein
MIVSLEIDDELVGLLDKHIAEVKQNALEDGVRLHLTPRMIIEKELKDEIRSKKAQLKRWFD